MTAAWKISAKQVNLLNCDQCIRNPSIVAVGADADRRDLHDAVLPLLQRPAKALLKRKGIAFKEIDIAANWERRDEMMRRASGQATVPQIFVGGRHVGGNAELQRLDAKSGELEAGVRGSIVRRRRGAVV